MITNQEFIKEYGRHNFYDLRDIIVEKLMYYKYKKIIKGYKIFNKKGYATIYVKDNKSINIQFAQLNQMQEIDFKNI